MLTKFTAEERNCLEKLHCYVTHFLTLTDNSKFTPITDLVNDAVNTSINPRKLKSVAL